MDIKDKFYEVIKNNDIENFQLLLNDKSINPSKDYNYAIQFASLNGHLDIVKLLLNDERVNPSDLDNIAIQFAFKNKHFSIVNLLWQNKRVKNSLENNDKYLYNKLIIKERVEEF